VKFIKFNIRPVVYQCGYRLSMIGERERERERGVVVKAICPAKKA
jgi:hypothetical protein